MKKCLLYLFSLTLFLAACKKDDRCDFNDSTVVATTAEIAYLQDYISTNSIQATAHPSGIFYHINSAGAGSSPGVCSTITIDYNGSLLGSAVSFETKNNVSFALGQLIIGWQKGLPLIKVGGNITLYIPPSLAYGAQVRYDDQGNVAIPANSYLKFVIKLSDVQ